MLKKDKGYKKRDVLREWHKLRDFLDPSVALQFSSHDDFRKALEIAGKEKIHYGLPGRQNLIVPPAMVCLFVHLGSEQIPIVSMGDLAPEEAARLRAKHYGPLSKEKLTIEEKTKRIKELKKE